MSNWNQGSNSKGSGGGGGGAGVTSINGKNGVIAQLDHTTDLANIGTNSHAAIDTHVASTSNPHSTTKAQVSLGSVTNDAQVKRTEMGAASGVAQLDSGTKVPEAQLPQALGLNYTNSATGFAYDALHDMRIQGALELPVAASGQTKGTNLADVNSRRHILGTGIGGAQASLSGALTDLFNEYSSVTTGGNITMPGGRGGIKVTSTLNVQAAHTLSATGINSGGTNGAAGAGGTSPTQGGAGTVGTATNHKTNSAINGGTAGAAGAIGGAGGNGLAGGNGAANSTQGGSGGGSGGGGGAAATNVGAAGTAAVNQSATTREARYPGLFISDPGAVAAANTTFHQPGGTGSGGAGGGGGGGANGGNAGAGATGGASGLSINIAADVLTIAGAITANGSDGAQGVKGTDGTVASGGGGSGGSGGAGGGGVIGLKSRSRSGTGTVNGGNGGAARTTFGAGAGGGGAGGQGGAGGNGGSGDLIIYDYT